MNYTTTREKTAGIIIAIMLITLIVTAVSGCQTIQTPEGRLDREKIIRTVNSAEIIFDVGLSFAELRGADPLTVARISSTAGIAFDLVRDALAVRLADTNPADLSAALLRLRLVVNDALLLCDSVGVSPPVMAEVRANIDRAFVVLEAVAANLGE